MRKLRTLGIALMMALGLMVAVAGTADAAPAVWYYGAGHTCAQAYPPSFDCVYYNDDLFRLQSTNGLDRLEWASSGGGNLIGWNNPGSSTYWFTSHTTGAYSLNVQADGNIVVYDVYGKPRWASGTNAGKGYEYRMTVPGWSPNYGNAYSDGVFYVERRESTGWELVCSVPQGWPSGDTCPGYQGNR